MLGKLVTALAFAATAIAQATIQTPAALVQCQPVALSFTGGQSPYFLSIIPGGQTQAAALVDFGQVASSPYTWTVNIAAGQSITIKITDSSGQTSYSAPVTIQSGSSSSCLSSSASGASSTSGGATGVASSASSAASSAVSSTVTSASSAASSAATSATAAASSVSSRASSAASGASSGASSAVSAASSAATSAAGTSGALPMVGPAKAGVALAVVGILAGAATLL